ncbi:MAG TPA: hypothetical protein VGO43_05355 [Pyrinomonadaceae bacterium]|jgi:hypothetical protein|nr:hypothetical protein [Pyrinomonadaceae bacterium]
MRVLTSLFVVVLACVAASGQKTNDTIQKQIKSLNADKAITLTYDRGGNSSKLMGVAGNFSVSDTKMASVEAMNFGMAFFYAGQQLDASPEYINLTFWVISKKPRFANGSAAWEVTLPSGTLHLGEYRYAGRPNENREYLNFKLLRSDLAHIASASSPVRFRLGIAQFTFTSEQIQLLRNFIALSETH